MLAYYLSANYRNNNEVEAFASLAGIKWCIQNGFTNFILKMDSLLIINMIKERHTDNTIDDISQCMNQVNNTPMHYYKEANQVADYLAKMASNNSGNKIYMSFLHLPREIKGPFIMDKFQVPIIITNYDKANIFVS